MKYTKEELEEMVIGTKNCYELLTKMGISSNPGNFTYWKNKVISLEIDISHWTIRSENKNNKKVGEECLINNDNLKFRISGGILKRNLLKIGRKYKCEVCELN